MTAPLPRARAALRCFTAAAVVLLVPSAALGELGTPDDQRLYAAAVKTMRALPEPPYVSFVTNVTSNGLRELLLRNTNGVGTLRIFGGKGEPSASWPTSYRQRDNVASIAESPLTHLVSHSPVFIPVWSGVYEWLRFGVDGRAFRSDTGPQPSAAADDPNLRVIGFVKAISPEAYRIGAGNAAICPGGEPARHLHLEARNGDTTMHPLADVTIDLGATRFCSVRFILPIRGGRGFSELHFGMVDGYWMTKSDDVESHAGLGSHRSELHIRYDDIRFPTTLDDALFTLTGK